MVETRTVYVDPETNERHLVEDQWFEMWNYNKWGKYSEIIEVKPDKEPNGKIAQLTAEGWEIINVHKGSIQLGKKKESEK